MYKFCRHVQENWFPNSNFYCWTWLSSVKIVFFCFFVKTVLLDGLDAWSRDWVHHGNSQLILWTGILCDMIISTFKVDDVTKRNAENYFKFLNKIFVWVVQIITNMSIAYLIPTTKKKKKKKGLKDTKLIEWLPASLDSNLTENLWSVIKRNLYKNVKEKMISGN